jgi:hypothetical protein
VGDDDLDLLHAGRYRGMITGVATGFTPCDYAADRVGMAAPDGHSSLTHEPEVT